MKIPDNKEGFDATIGTGCNIDNRNVFINPVEPQPYTGQMPSPELDCSIENLLLGAHWRGWQTDDDSSDYVQITDRGFFEVESNSV